MILNIQTLNVTTLPNGMIAHGVNCQRAMGSGIALALMTKWPDVRTKYMKMPKGPMMLGFAHFIDIDDGVTVANCYTQEYFGSDGKRYADAKWVKTAMSQAFIQAEMEDVPLYAPQIGCGLGGLDWDREVKPIFEDLNNKHPKVDFTVCIWPQYEKTEKNVQRNTKQGV